MENGYQVGVTCYRCLNQTGESVDIIFDEFCEDCINELAQDLVFE